MNTLPCRVAATLVLACCAATAHADINKVIVAIEHTDYADGHGRRDIASVGGVGSFGATTLVLDAAAGRRAYGENEAFSGSRMQATAYRDWHRALSTRTAITLSSNDPVFVNRDIAHDFNFKVIPNTVLSVGGRSSEYHGGERVSAWSAGATYYFPRLSASYRHTGYRRSSGGNSNGNLLSIRLKDSGGDGATQLWLGKGSSVHAYDGLSELQDGQLKNATLRRVQPITSKVSFDLALGKSWYETPTSKYDGLSARIGAVYSW